MDRYDVVVVGAGPGGATAALWVARAGARVALLDRQAFPRFKTCGGGVVLRARRLLLPDITPVVERSAATARFFLADAGLHFVARSETADPLISLTRRDRLDELLATAAQGAGARFLAPCRVTGLTQRDRDVLLTTDQGPILTEFVVGADGALSDVARLGGWMANPYLAPALECEVPVDTASLPDPCTEPRFEIGNVAEGYAWVFPKAAHWSVGVVSAHRGYHDLAAELERHLARAGLAGVAGSVRHGFVIPVRPRPGPPARGRILLVGDAAGLADPVAVEGITHAVQSGMLAGQSIVEARGDADRAQGTYAEALRSDLLGELRIGRGIARALYGKPRLRAIAFRRFGTQLVTAFVGVFAGDRTYRQSLESPLLRALTALS